MIWIIIINIVGTIINPVIPKIFIPKYIPINDTNGLTPKFLAINLGSKIFLVITITIYITNKPKAIDMRFVKALIMIQGIIIISIPKTGINQK